MIGFQHDNEVTAVGTSRWAVGRTGRKLFVRFGRMAYLVAWPTNGRFHNSGSRWRSGWQRTMRGAA